MEAFLLHAQINPEEAEPAGATMNSCIALTLFDENPSPLRIAGLGFAAVATIFVL